MCRQVDRTDGAIDLRNACGFGPLRSVTFGNIHAAQFFVAQSSV